MQVRGRNPRMSCHFILLSIVSPRSYVFHPLVSPSADGGSVAGSDCEGAVSPLRLSLPHVLQQQPQLSTEAAATSANAPMPLVPALPAHRGVSAGALSGESYGVVNVNSLSDRSTGSGASLSDATEEEAVAAAAGAAVSASEGPGGTGTGGAGTGVLPAAGLPVPDLAAASEKGGAATFGDSPVSAVSAPHRDAPAVRARATVLAPGGAACGGAASGMPTSPPPLLSASLAHLWQELRYPDGWLYIVAVPLACAAFGAPRAE